MRFICKCLVFNDSFKLIKVLWNTFWRCSLNSKFRQSWWLHDVQFRPPSQLVIVPLNCKLCFFFCNGKIYIKLTQNSKLLQTCFIVFPCSSMYDSLSCVNSFGGTDKGASIHSNKEQKKPKNKNNIQKKLINKWSKNGVNVYHFGLRADEILMFIFGWKLQGTSYKNRQNVPSWGSI